jgi:hypothetical protein
MWTAGEAAALGLGVDPHAAGREARAMERAPSLARALADRSRLLRRLADAGRIRADGEPPAVLVATMRSIGLTLPDELVRVVEAVADRVDWQARAKALERRVRDLEAEAAHGSAGPADLGERERTSLLKLIIGMAMGGYGHDPKASKSKATKEIADDLDRLGIGLDADTVRKYLREARDLLPRKTE